MVGGRPQRTQHPPNPPQWCAFGAVYLVVMPMARAVAGAVVDNHTAVRPAPRRGRVMGSQSMSRHDVGAKRAAPAMQSATRRVWLPSSWWFHAGGAAPAPPSAGPAVPRTPCKDTRSIWNSPLSCPWRPRSLQRRDAGGVMGLQSMHHHAVGAKRALPQCPQ